MISISYVLVFGMMKGKKQCGTCLALLAFSAWLPVLGIYLTCTTIEHLVSYLGLHSSLLEAQEQLIARKAGKAMASLELVHMHGVTWPDLLIFFFFFFI